MQSRYLYSFSIFLALLATRLAPTSAQAAPSTAPPSTGLALTGGGIVTVQTANLNQRPSHKAEQLGDIYR